MNIKKWEIQKEIYKKQKQLGNQILQSSQIIATTLTSIYNKRFNNWLQKKNNFLFDYVIIDEAGQALNILAAMGIFYARKVVFAGDHLQLQPTIKDQKQLKGYKTLF